MWKVGEKIHIFREKPWGIEIEKYESWGRNQWYMQEIQKTEQWNVRKDTSSWKSSWYNAKNELKIQYNEKTN